MVRKKGEQSPFGFKGEHNYKYEVLSILSRRAGEPASFWRENVVALEIFRYRI